MSDETKTTLGKLLREKRESLFLTLRDVENETGVSNAYLSQLENDKNKNPSANILHKLAEFYKVDFSYLLSSAGLVKKEVDSPASTNFADIVFSSEVISKEEAEELRLYLKFMRLKEANKL